MRKRNHNAKLTVKQVRKIATLLRRGWSTVTIGKKFGVNKATIGYIAVGKTWQDVTGFKRFMFVAHGDNHPHRLPHDCEQTEKPWWSPHKLRTSMLDRVARKLDEPGMLSIFMKWWIDRIHEAEGRCRKDTRK